MGLALKVYEAFRDVGEDKARVLAEALEALEREYQRATEVATKRDLAETELKLRKEIESVRREIEEVRLEVKRVRKEVKETGARLVRWMFTFWTGQVIALVGILKWLLATPK